MRQQQAPHFARGELPYAIDLRALASIRGTERREAARGERMMSACRRLLESVLHRPGSRAPAAPAARRAA
jgi:hypothetical protein